MSPFLTPHQERFVAEYLVDFDAASAGLRAGYAPRHARISGWQALRHPRVNDAIRASLAARAAEGDDTAAEALARLPQPIPLPERQERPALSARRQAFVENYLASLNARDAAQRAGYSARTAGAQGCILLKRPAVAAAVRTAMAERAQQNKLSVNRVIEGLMRLAFSDLGRLVDWGPEGVTVKPNAALSEDDRAAIAGLSLRTDKDGRTHLQIRLHDKRGALASLARYVKLYEQPTPEEVDARSEETQARRKKFVDRFIEMAHEWGEQLAKDKIAAAVAEAEARGRAAALAEMERQPSEGQAPAPAPVPAPES